METIPAGLEALLEHGDLPVVALTAAAEQSALRAALSRRERLPAAVIERCFIPGAPPGVLLAHRLVSRRLPARTVRWVLGGAGERRPEVLAALVGVNVPESRERQRLLVHPDPRIADAILANPAWPVDEQLTVVRRADGVTVLWWLARLDPSVPVTDTDLGLDGSAGRRLDGDPVTALQAMLRRPWLAELAPSLLGHGVRSAAATVASDERTLYALLGYAQRLGRGGRLRDAAGIVEAVACNPTASLAVQRRCRKLARRLPCHYLDGWLPRGVAAEPLDEVDVDAQLRVVERLEELTAVRHRTVWSAGLLAANDHLGEDVRRRLVAYVEEHLPAVEGDGSSVDVLADRLRVPAATRKRWRRGRLPFPPGGCLPPFPPGGCLVDYDEHGQEWGPRLPWEDVMLEDVVETAVLRMVCRRLRAAFRTDQEAWSLALLLLREGWDLPLAELPPVVAALCTPREVAA
jgi:hypothetical protein